MKVFLFSRRVAFCDTDAMGVVHHANFVRYLEEARVAWMRENNLQDEHFPRADVVFAVIRMQIHHEAPAFFDDLLNIRLQVRRDGLKIHFQYAIYRDLSDTRIAWGETVHVPVNKELKPVRPNKKLFDHLEREPWTETWPSNL